MLDNRAHTRFGIGPKSAALLAFFCIVQSLLISSFRNAYALNADQQAGIVHHREHTGEAAIFFANQVTDSPGFLAFHKTIAIDHGAGGGGVDAHLMFKTRAEHVIATSERTIRIDEKFRDEKQRYAFVPGGASGRRASTR